MDPPLRSKPKAYVGSDRSKSHLLHNHPKAQHLLHCIWEAFLNSASWVSEQGSLDRDMMSDNVI